MAPPAVPAASVDSGYSEKTRVRVQAIDFQPKTSSRYPIFLKLVIDGVARKLPTIERGQRLQWKADISFDVMRKSVIRVEVREVHTFFDRTAVSLGSSGQEVLQTWLSTGNKNRELKLSQRGSTMTIQFASIGTAVNLAATEYASKMAAERTENTQSILSELGRARSAVETIMGLAGQLAEVHPAAKAAFTAINWAFNYLEQEESYNTNIQDLSLGMADMLAFVKIVQERAKIARLKEIVVQMMTLIEDASYFIVEYLSDGRFQRYLESTIASNAHSRIDGFIKQFGKLRDQFDRGVEVQVLDTVMTMQEESILANLHSLVAGCGPSYDDERACMDGTRRKVLQDISQWTTDTTGSQPLLWIHGLAGSGKSSIATSAAKNIHEQGCLGATFFCKRDNPYLRDSNLVIPRIASRLASANKPLAKVITAALQHEPNLATEAISLQFQGLIRTTLGKVPVPEKPTVVIVDALDECGTSESVRTQLLLLLQEMAGLVPWLKVIMTSRPDPDILNFFDTHGTSFRRLDLDKEEPYEDIVTFTRARMAEIAQRDPSLPRMWPGEEMTSQFARRAGRLFVWARVASDFIAGALDPQHQLDVVLTGKPDFAGRGPYVHLDELYTTALEHNIGEDSHSTMIFRNVVGTIVAIATRNPLPVKGIKTLLEGEDIRPGIIDNTIRRLQSVLYEDRKHNNSVRLCHPSFVDFLTDQSRCGKRFFIDLEQQHVNVASRCLRTMTSGLKFNICGLESSHQFNADIADLKTRVNHAISEGLAYSCIHWHSHLGDASKDDQARKRISQHLEGFLSHARPLYWLEALSLLEALPSAISGLPNVVEWFENPEDKQSRFAADLHRFVAAFYEPISQSAPHLYISALPFAPRRSIVSESLLPIFRNTLSIKSGQEIHWSACLHTSDGHSGAIWSVAFSPDGRKIVSGSSDKTIRFWDAKTGAMIATVLEGHSGEVTCVAVSPDGRKIVSGSFDKTVRIWDAETGVAVSGPLEGHSSEVTSVDFSPDGRKFASGSADMTVRIWDADTGREICSPLKGHSGEVLSVAFSQKGRKIASGSSDKTIRIWDAETCTAVSSPLKGHSGEVTSVAFSPDGRKIASGSVDGTVRIWDAEGSTMVSSPLVGHSGTVFSVTFSPDGRKVASGSWDNTIRLWSVEVGTAVSSILEGHSGTVMSVVFSPDGQQIASGSRDNTLRIWDVEAAAAVSSFVEGHMGPVWSVAFSPNGRRLVSGARDKTVRIWDVETGGSVFSPLEGHSEEVLSVVFSPDGRYVASGSRDKTIRIWDAETGTAVSTLEGHSGTVFSVAFSPDSQTLVSGSFDKTIQTWDVNKCTWLSSTLEGHTGAVTSVTFSPDGHKIASGSFDKTIRIWNATTCATASHPLEGHTDAIRSVAFSPDGRKIVSGSWDNTIRTWDIETGAPISSTHEGDFGMVTPISVSPTSQTTVLGSFEKTIRIWDSAAGATISNLLEGHSGRAWSVVFSPDGRKLVSGSFDKTIQMWDADTCVQVSSPLEGHWGTVESVAISPDGQRIASGSFDRTIRIWDATGTERQKTTLVSTDKTGSSNQIIRSGVHVDLVGWMRQSQDPALLLWVPFAYRSAIVDQSITIMPPSAAITIDFGALRHGTSWTDVHI